jgi:hypothetical protein
MVLEKETGKEVAKFYTSPSTDQLEMQKNQPSLQRFRQFFDFAGVLIPVSKRDTDEMQLMANAGRDPGLTILGFKPRGSIPFYHSVSATFLIYPNDDVVQGSRQAFAQLHSSMLRKNVLAIGEALHRSTWQSRLVAIYPLEEVESEDNYLAPCMMVTQLPFEDDIRAVVPDEASKEIDRQQEQQKSLLERTLCSNPDAISSNPDIFATPEDGCSGNIASEQLVSAAMELLSRQHLASMELGFDFENAAMTEFYTYLKNIAFNTTHETPTFDTRLDEDLVLQVAKREIVTFSACLPDDVKNQPAQLRKRPKDFPPDESGIDWVELHEAGKLGACKIEQLKQYLRSVGKSSVLDITLQHGSFKSVDQTQSSSTRQASLFREERMNWYLVSQISWRNSIRTIKGFIIRSKWRPNPKHGRKRLLVPLVQMPQWYLPLSSPSHNISNSQNLKLQYDSSDFGIS